MAKEKKKILIVEDESSLATALAEALGNAGFEAHQARNGTDGLSRAIEIKPALILLDLLMPKMDGATMLKKLREDAWGKTVPVIILTNVDAMTSVAAVIGEAPDYMVKADWKLEDVIARVKERLK